MERHEVLKGRKDKAAEMSRTALPAGQSEAEGLQEVKPRRRANGPRQCRKRVFWRVDFL
jgi:hypothetical protein